MRPTKESRPAPLDASAAEQEPIQAVEDLELVRRALQRDHQAIETLLGRLRCVRRILSSKNQQLGRRLNSADLEDATQDALLSIWERLESYQGRGSLEAWAYRFCHFVLLSRIRKLGSGVPLQPGEFEPEELAQELSSQPDPLLAERVYQALEDLGPPDADVIRWKHLEQLTFDEISERTGIASNTLKSRYYRGLLKLRVGLGLPESGDREAQR